MALLTILGSHDFCRSCLAHHSLPPTLSSICGCVHFSFRLVPSCDYRIAQYLSECSRSPCSWFLFRRTSWPAIETFSVMKYVGRMFWEQELATYRVLIELLDVFQIGIWFKTMSSIQPLCWVTKVLKLMQYAFLQLQLISYSVFPQIVFQRSPISLSQLTESLQWPSSRNIGSNPTQPRDSTWEAYIQLAFHPLQI
jgi:hypothetical protein